MALLCGVYTRLYIYSPQKERAIRHSIVFEYGRDNDRRPIRSSYHP